MAAGLHSVKATMDPDAKTAADYERIALELEEAREMIVSLHEQIKQICAEAAYSAQLHRELSALRGERDE